LVIPHLDSTTATVATAKMIQFKKEAAGQPVPHPPPLVHQLPPLSVVTGMRVVPSKITMLIPVVPVKPSVPIPAIIIRPAIITANNDRTRTAPGKKDRRRKYGRGRQKHRHRERKPEPSRLRRRASRTNAHRYQTE
jgi:hypothetical protein